MTSLDRLTAREREVLKLVADGTPPRRMTALTGLSSSAIDVYVRRIMIKLKIDDLAALVRFARRHGFVTS